MPHHFQEMTSVDISFPSSETTERSFLICGERPTILVKLHVKHAQEQVSNFLAMIDSISIKPIKHPFYQQANRMRSVDSFLSDKTSQSYMSSALSSPIKRDTTLSPTDLQHTQIDTQDAFLIDEDTIGIQFSPLIDSELEFSEATATFKVIVYETTPIDLLNSTFIREPRLGASFLRNIVEESDSVGYRIEVMKTAERSIDLKRILSASLVTAKLDNRTAALDFILKPEFKDILANIKSIELNIKDVTGGTAGLISSYKIIADSCFLLEMNDDKLSECNILTESEAFSWTCRLVRERLPVEFFSEKRDFRVFAQLQAEIDDVQVNPCFECPIDLKGLFHIDQSTQDITIRFTTLADVVYLNVPFHVSLLIKNDSDRVFEFELEVDHKVQKGQRRKDGSVYERWKEQSTPPFICLETEQRLGPVKPKSCRETTLRFIPLKEGSHFLLPIKLTLSDIDEQHRVIEVVDAHKITVTNKVSA